MATCQSWVDSGGRLSARLFLMQGALVRRSRLYLRSHRAYFYQKIQRNGPNSSLTSSLHLNFACLTDPSGMPGLLKTQMIIDIMICHTSGKSTIQRNTKIYIVEVLAVQTCNRREMAQVRLRESRLLAPSCSVGRVIAT